MLWFQNTPRLKAFSGVLVWMTGENASNEVSLVWILDLGELTVVLYVFEGLVWMHKAPLHSRTLSLIFRMVRLVLYLYFPE